MGSFSRELPNKVLQYKEPNKTTCWAGAIESWMSVTPNSPASWYLKTQDDAIEHYEMFMDSKGGLEVKTGFAFLAAGVGMEYKVCKPSTKLIGSLLYSKLRYRGHVYLLYAGGMATPSGLLGHCVVIYGISNPWSKNCEVSYMDPWFGDYRKAPLTHFQQANESVASWFEYTG